MTQFNYSVTTKTYKKIGFKIIGSNHLLIKAKVNQQTAWLILDTGASNSCFAENFIEEFNLTAQNSEIIAASASQNNLETQISHQNNLKIGHWENTNFSFVIMDLATINTALSAIINHPIHGIIGSDLLINHHATIDYPNQKLFIK